MENHDKQFLMLYQENRHKDQATFYKLRHDEYEKARRQAIIVAGVLMFMAAIVSFLTTNPLIGTIQLWAVMGTIFPALSTALTAYNSIFAFEQQSKLYQDALFALHKAEANVYELLQVTDEADFKSRLAAYVTQVEEILQKELGQWGQLISQLKPIEVPGQPEKDQSPEPPPSADPGASPDEPSPSVESESAASSPDSPSGEDAAEPSAEPQPDKGAETSQPGDSDKPTG